MGTGRVLVAMLVAAILAGCAEGSGTARNSTAPTSKAPTFVQQHEGEGVLEGKAVDDEQRAIPGVEIQVALASNASEALATLATDVLGRFTVSGLAGGAYVVYAHKIGYREAAPRLVNVVEGETRNVTFVLEPLAAIVPFHHIERYTAEFLNAFCVLYLEDYQCTVNGYSGPHAVWDFDVKEDERGDLVTLLVETQWTAGAAAVCPGYFRSDVFSPDQEGLGATFPNSYGSFVADSNPYHWDSVPESYKSPTRLAIQREGDPLAMHSESRTELNGGEPIETSGKWTVDIDYYPQGASAGQPVGMYCVVNQAVNSFVTFFHVEPMPAADWSAMAP